MNLKRITLNAYILFNYIISNLTSYLSIYLFYWELYS